MANRFFSPNQQFCDVFGAPYAGGTLSFYASGTSTPLNTYSDSALTIANANPVPLDSAGRAGSVFLQNLAYKVVLADVNNNQIWTEDPVYSSDFSTVAQFQSGSGSPNGVLAGNQGSPTVPASAYWDSTNDILYVCTQTGTTSTAVWTAVNTGAATSVIVPPQGYLSLAVPFPTSDVIDNPAVYYAPYIGTLLPLYNGSSFALATFAQLTLTLASAHTQNNLYDVFVFSNSGVVTVATGPAWTNSTAGSSARGSGAGTTQLSSISGLWVNAVSMTARNGTNTYTVAANRATYVGTILINGSGNGLVTCHRSVGQSRSWGVWNAYNRIPITLQVQDTTALWTVAANTIQSMNANNANRATMVVGLQEDTWAVDLCGITEPGNTCRSGYGIGFNSTTVFSGFNNLFGNPNNVSAPLGASTASLKVQPLGTNYFQAMDVNQGTNASNNIGIISNPPIYQTTGMMLLGRA